MQDETLVFTTPNGIASTIKVMEMPLGPHAGTYRLDLSFNTLCEAESYMGDDNLLKAAGGIIGLVHLRAIFYAAGMGQHGLESLDDAGEMIGANPNAFLSLVEALQTAAVSMLPLQADASGN